MAPAFFTGMVAAFTAEQRPLSRQFAWPFSPEYQVAILIAARAHGMEIVERACRKAISDKTIRSEVVLNLIARELDPPAVDPVFTPERLSLKEEPIANCARYDALRQEVSHAAS